MSLRGREGVGAREGAREVGRGWGPGRGGGPLMKDSLFLLISNVLISNQE